MKRSSEGQQGTSPKKKKKKEPFIPQPWYIYPQPGAKKKFPVSADDTKDLAWAPVLFYDKQHGQKEYQRFSNLSKGQIAIDGATFGSVEAYFQSQKYNPSTSDTKKAAQIKGVYRGLFTDEGFEAAFGRTPSGPDIFFLGSMKGVPGPAHKHKLKERVHQFEFDLYQEAHERYEQSSEKPFPENINKKLKFVLTNWFDKQTHTYLAPRPKIRKSDGIAGPTTWTAIRRELNFRFALDPKWNTARFEAMSKALWVKFQDPILSQSLRSTADRDIVEFSPRDREWGGYHPAIGAGKNYLGQLLMHTRSRLKGQESTLRIVDQEKYIIQRLKQLRSK